jgi:hypothetical protein
MGWIPTKVLYKLQVSVVQEVQSCTHTETIDLQHTKDNREELYLVLEKVKIETKYEKYRTNRLEKGLALVYDIIPKSVQIEEPMMTQKIDQIVQTINQYMKDIENLQEQLIPTTPLEVKEQRKQEVAGKMEKMELQVNVVVDLFDRATQIWIKLEEDQQVQHWDQEEENIMASI